MILNLLKILRNFYNLPTFEEVIDSIVSFNYSIKDEIKHLVIKSQQKIIFSY